MNKLSFDSLNGSVDRYFGPSEIQSFVSPKRILTTAFLWVVEITLQPVRAYTKPKKFFHA